MLKFLLIFSLLTMSSPSFFAQQPFLLPSGAKSVEVKNFLKEGFYLIVSDTLLDEKKLEGVKVVKIINSSAHIVHIPGNARIKILQKHKFYEIPTDWKLSAALKNFQPKGHVLLSIHTLDAKQFERNLGIEALQKRGNFVVVKVTAAEYEQILESDLVTHISRYNSPSTETPVNQHDLAVNNINYAHNIFPEIRGEDLKVSIKESLFDTADIDLQNRFVETGLEAGTLDRHATFIATLIAGAGNSSERGRGVAPAATVTSTSFLWLFPENESFYTQNKIYVQNHSYGTGVEIEYGNEAAAYDQSVNEVPQLVHVFSAGNKGEETSNVGPYIGVQGYGTITGNYKMAKNVITVGAVNNEKQLERRSSKGPTGDGRIKPELVAYAPEGTSDAAALVSGTALLLQDLYKKKEGMLPTAALVKAALIAGAEDVGRERIDFSTGYGNLNASKSLEIINNGNFINSHISANSTESFTLNIPADTKELKIAISWNDPAANPGDEIVLKNDLDLKIQAPDGQTFLPWILNPVPDIASIEAPARRGEDHLNTAELITVENPIPGEYTIYVSAGNIQGEVQPFAIAYATSAKNDFFWTFPGSGEAFINSGEAYVRWENTFAAQRGKLEYNLNDEGWVLVSENIDLDKDYYPWEVLNKSGRAQLKMSIGSREFVSGYFAVGPELTPAVSYNCEEQLQLVWEKVENATKYQLQNLGSLYMEDVLEVRDTSAVLDKNRSQSSIWSVIPLYGETRGPRGNAIDYEQQGVSCYYRNFIALLDGGPVVNTSLYLSTTAGIEKVLIQKELNGEVTTIQEFHLLNILQLEMADEDVKEGHNLYFATIILSNGTEIKTEAVAIFVPGNETLEIFPNPVRAGEELTVISKGDDLEIQVFDLQGRMLSEDNLIRFRDRFEIKFFAPGMYLIRALRKGRRMGTAKVLVY